MHGLVEEALTLREHIVYMEWNEQEQEFIGSLDTIEDVKTFMRALVKEHDGHKRDYEYVAAYQNYADNPNDWDAFLWAIDTHPESDTIKELTLHFSAAWTLHGGLR